MEDVDVFVQNILNSNLIITLIGSVEKIKATILNDEMKYLFDLD